MTEGNTSDNAESVTHTQRKTGLGWHQGPSGGREC